MKFSGSSARSQLLCESIRGDLLCKKPPSLQMYAGAFLSCRLGWRCSWKVQIYVVYAWPSLDPRVHTYLARIQNFDRNWTSRIWFCVYIKQERLEWRCRICKLLQIVNGLCKVVTPLLLKCSEYFYVVFSEKLVHVCGWHRVTSTTQRDFI